MFGTTRFILAVSVVVFHLTNYSSVIGFYSVQGFFILSGYLMTSVMRNKYKYNITGITVFIIKRIVRIYPAYWFSILISLIVITLDPITSQMCHPFLTFPNDFSQWISNIFLFGKTSSSKLIPPGWSLLTEFFYYILISLYLTKYNTLISLWFLFSIFTTFYLNFYTDDNNWIEYLYFDPLSSSLSFSIGALIFVIAKKINILYNIFQGTYSVIILNMIIITFFFISTTLFNPHCNLKEFKVSYYINMTLIALIILILSNTTTTNLIFKKTDSFLGELSYPLYLLHWPIYSAIQSLFWRLSLPNYDIVILLVVILSIIIISVFSIIPFERYIKFKFETKFFEK